MRAIAINKGKIVFEVSRDELDILASALYIACTTLEEWEFQTRIGVTVDEAKVILDYFKSIYLNS